MSAPQITPGPWVTAKSNCGYINVTVGSYLYTPRWTGIGHTPEMEANARLIAATPELYQLCERAMQWFDDNGCATGLAEVIRETLAKARGEQS